MGKLDRYIGHDPEMADKLRKILAGARSIKQCIQKVGEDLAPAKPPAPGREPEHPRLRGLRVLVADNDERVRRSAHGILGRWGCVVETARDGEETLTMARLGSYDAILADIRLPDLNGYEMYRRLREAQPQARAFQVLQVQAMAESFGPLTEAEQREVEQFFQAGVEAVRAKCLEALRTAGQR